MESRIKERLTGALILVAALVVLVPEIFSGKRGSESAHPEAAAPAADAPPLRTYTSEPDAAAPPLVQAPVEPAVSAPAAEQPEPEPVSAPEPAPPVVAQVRPQPAPQPSAGKPSAPAAAGDWYVQVGSFSQAANAQRYAQQLRGEGFTAVVLPASGAKALVRVRVGPVRNREAAVQLLNKLTASGHKGAVVGP